MPINNLADLNAANSALQGAGQSNFGQSFKNIFTGNKDWEKDNIRQQQQFNYNAYLQQVANDFNSAEAQKNRDYQTLMSNTAYQRAAADMKAAGFNPALAVANQKGASTPSGSSASSASASTSQAKNSGSGNPIKGVSSFFKMISSAFEAVGDFQDLF